MLGELPSARGCYIISGSNECGVTHGPGLGKLLAELIVDGRASQDITALRPDRWEVPREPAQQLALAGGA